MSSTTNKPRVLIVEDEPEMRIMLAFVLGQEGFEIESVDSGPAALQAAEARRFDVAITDLMMPRMSGLDTLAALKRIDPAMEVIVATAYGSIDTAVAAIKGGAFDYIQKPFDLSELRLRIGRAVEKRRSFGMVALWEASRQLLETMRRSDLVTMVMQLAAKVAVADSVALAVRHRDSETYRFHRTAGSPSPSDALLEALAEATRGAALRYPSRQLDQLPPLRCDGVIATALLLPLTVDQRRYGLLALFRGPGAALFSEMDAQRTQVFAAQAALAIDNDAMYFEAERRIREAQGKGP